MTARRQLFGTDGVRGTANREPMTVETALALGQAVVRNFQSRSGRHRILIGKDTRLSGYMFETALSAGICSMGGDAILVGPMPTPAIAFLTQSMRADAGVVISASHNPFQDNGIKFFGRDGFKLPDAEEARIEELMRSGGLATGRPVSAAIGRAKRIDDATGRYIVFLKNTFPARLSLEGLRIVVDCANGAAYRLAPLVFQELGAEVIPVGVAPNGVNINDACGSLHPEVAAAKVKEHRADLGVTLDGDADRVILIDQKGTVLDGDRIMATCAEAMMARKALRKNAVVSTVMSNIGLEIFLRERKCSLLRTPVGDRYVVEEMRAGGYNFGGEQSGHLVFLDHSTTGDGILAALQVLSVMVGNGRAASELCPSFTAFPQVLKNVRMKERVPLERMKAFQKALKEFEEALGRKGRILVRYSGTEPLLRIMAEGENPDQVEEIVDALVEKAAGFGKGKGR